MESETTAEDTQYPINALERLGHTSQLSSSSGNYMLLHCRLVFQILGPPDIIRDCPQSPMSSSVATANLCQWSSAVVSDRRMRIYYVGPSLYHEFGNSIPWT